MMPASPSALAAIRERNRSFGFDRFPFGFWSTTAFPHHAAHITEATADEWADAGMTLIESPHYAPDHPESAAFMRRVLGWAEERRMKVIACNSGLTYPRDGLPPPDLAGRIRRALSELGDPAALLGFHVGDEPREAHREGCYECVRIHRETAPHRVPFLNHGPYEKWMVRWKRWDEWASYLDTFCSRTQAGLLSFDIYYQMNPPEPGEPDLHVYHENLRMYREASLRNRVPWWVILLSTGHFRYRCPSLDDLRWQLNTAVASGAQGIQWFLYNLTAPYGNYRLAPIDEFWEKTQTYWDLRRIQRGFLRTYGNLFLRLGSTRVEFFPRPYGEGAVFAGDEVVSELTTDAPGHPLLLGRFVDEAGRPHIMLVNHSQTACVRAGMRLPGRGVKAYSFDWNGVEVERPARNEAHGWSRDDAGLTVTHWLAPGQEAVYRVEGPDAG